MLLHLKDGRLPTKANIPLSEVFLIRLPKDQEILLKAFLSTERLGVSVDGMVYKAWDLPGLSKAWQRLNKCKLWTQ